MAVAVQDDNLDARTGPTRPPNQSETHEGPAESGSLVRASSSKERAVHQTFFHFL